MFQLIYGLTECTGSVFQSVPTGIKEESPKFVKYVQEHMEVKVIDEHDQTVPFGTPGELCVRGYSIMSGYWKDEEKTNDLIGQDGWLRTGFVSFLSNFIEM